jgi:hypothetical protein
VQSLGWKAATFFEASDARKSAAEEIEIVEWRARGALPPMRLQAGRVGPHQVVVVHKHPTADGLVLQPSGAFMGNSLEERSRIGIWLG